MGDYVVRVGGTSVAVINAESGDMAAGILRDLLREAIADSHPDIVRLLPVYPEAEADNT